MASRLDILIERFHSKTISNAEHEELLSLLADNQHARIARKFFKEIIDNQPQDAQYFSANKSAELLQSILKEKPVVRNINWFKWAGVAAAACLLIMLGVWMWQPAQTETQPIVQEKTTVPDLQPGNKNKAILILADNSTIELDSTGAGILSTQGNARITKSNDGQIIYENASASTETLYNILKIPNGGEYQLVLSDGSRVWLNSASTLKYPVNFSGNTRDVELSGEAYFEIAKNKAKPFKVHFNHSEVEVLGTHFNVNAYDNESMQAVTLLEGSVKVSKAANARLIKPGQQATIGQTNLIDVQSVNSEDVIAWKNGYFMFADEDIKSIMRKLARWYDFTPEYQGHVEGERFAAMISRYRNISEVLKMFESTGTIKFKIIPGDASGKGKKIIVIK
jgi:transmembrane sensor